MMTNTVNKMTSKPPVARRAGGAPAAPDECGVIGQVSAKIRDLRFTLVVAESHTPRGTGTAPARTGRARRSS